MAAGPCVAWAKHSRTPTHTLVRTQTLTSDVGGAMVAKLGVRSVVTLGF